MSANNTGLRGALAAVFMALSVVAVHAQVTLSDAEGSGRSWLNASSLIPMTATGGTGSTVGAANAQALNDYFSGAWRTTRRSPILAGLGYGVSESVEIDGLEGFAFRGQGVGDVRAESQYEATIGGNVSRLVWTNSSSQAGPMIRYGGGYLALDGVMFQGWFNANNLATLKSEDEHYVDVGLLVEGQQSGIGTGKITGDEVVFACFGTAIQMGEAFNEDNADQLNIQSLRTPNCSVGIHAVNHQSVGHWIGQYEVHACPNPLYFERGGKLRVDQITLLTPEQVMLRSRYSPIDSATYQFGSVYVDANAGNNCTLWQMDEHLPNGEDGIPSTADDEQAAASHMTIDWLQIAASITTAPKFVLRGYSVLHIRGGDWLMDEMVVVHGGSTNYHPTIILENCRFRSGEIPANVIASGSDGKCDIVMKNCKIAGQSSFLNDVRFTWVNGTRIDY